MPGTMQPSLECLTSTSMSDEVIDPAFETFRSNIAEEPEFAAIRTNFVRDKGNRISELD